MEIRHWQQTLRKHLKRERVSLGQAERLLQELSDHLEDLKEAYAMEGKALTEREIVEQMGSPQAIARETAKHRFPTWAGRHPWMSFVISAPLISFALIIAVGILVGFCVVPFVQGRSLDVDPWLGPLMKALGIAQVVVPTLLASLLICRGVNRSQRQPWWALAGCLLIALIAAATVVQWTFPASAGGTGQLSLGVSLPFSATFWQGLIPLAIGVAFLLYKFNSRGNDRDETPTQLNASS